MPPVLALLVLSAPPVSFIKDVAPILKENCFACHDARKKSGKYDMTTFEKLRAGGAAGEPIVPGKPADSDFHDLIVTADDRRMPPRDKGEPVPKDKAELVARWIAEGAKLDAGLDPKADLVRELRTRWVPPPPPEKYTFPPVVNALAFTPDGKRLVVGGHHELTVWDIEPNKLVTRISTRAERAYAMAFLPNGRLVVAGGRPGQEGDLRVYDLSAPGPRLDGVNEPKVMVKKLLDADDSVLCLALSADGKTMAAGGCDRLVRVWDILDGGKDAKLVQTVENHADWVLGVALSADGKKLVTAGRDKTAKVYDLAAKEPIQTFPDHQAVVYAVGLKADGTAGYSVGADKQLRSWKVGGDGKQTRNRGEHSDEVFKFVPHPKQPMAFTASADKTVRSWHLDKMEPGKTFAGGADFVYAVAVSPDGERVAAGGYDGRVSVWKTADAAPVNAFFAAPGYVPKPPAAVKK